MNEHEICDDVEFYRHFNRKPTNKRKPNMNASKEIAPAETEWEAADPEAVRAQIAEHEKEVAERNARTAQVKMAEPGDYTFRFLPPVKGTKLWAFKTWIHYIRNPADAESKGRPVVCPSKTRDARCIVCEWVSALYKKANAGDAKAKEAAGNLRSKESYFANVVRVDNVDGMKAGPKILALPQTVYDALAKIYVDENKGGDFTHPKTGYKVIITRVGKTMETTKYTVALSVKQTPLENMDWLKHMHILSKHVEEMTTEDMTAILEGREKAPEYQEPAPSAKRIGAAPPADRVPGEDDGDDGDLDEVIQDPEDPGEYASRRVLRAAGRKV